MSSLSDSSSSESSRDLPCMFRNKKMNNYDSNDESISNIISQIAKLHTKQEQCLNDISTILLRMEIINDIKENTKYTNKNFSLIFKELNEIKQILQNTNHKKHKSLTSKNSSQNVISKPRQIQTSPDRHKLLTENNTSYRESVTISYKHVGSKMPFHKNLSRKQEIVKLEDNEIKNKTNSLVMKNIHTNEVHCFSVLKNNKIVTGSYKSIAISSYNFSRKEWKKEIFVGKAHDDWVNSLYELPGTISNIGKIISASRDSTIKIWKIIDSKIFNIKKISAHKGSVRTAIAIPNNRIASCSCDCSIKIWKNNDKYEQLLEMTDLQSEIVAILYLKSKDELVSSSPTHLSFWNLNTYERVCTLKECYAYLPSHMVELNNSYLALSSNTGEKPLVIVDITNYEIYCLITLDEMVWNSSLCMLNENCFIYLLGNNILQFSVDNFSVMRCLGAIGIGGLCGYFGIQIVENGKFLVVSSEQGVAVIQINN